MVKVDGVDTAIDDDEYTVTVVATDPKGIPTDDATAAAADLLFSDTVPM